MTTFLPGDPAWRILGRSLPGLVAGFALLPAAAADPAPYRELGVPLAQHFTPRDFHAHSQSLGAAVDGRGILHVANLTAVLEYDGESWRHADIPGVNSIYHLGIDGDDTVYVGLAGDLGRLRADGRGGRTFESLLARVPEDFRGDVDAVRRVVVTPRGVFFQCTRAVLRWRDESFRGWRFESKRPLALLWSGSSLFVHLHESGLQRLDGETFVPVADDPRLLATFVTGVFDLAGGDRLLVLRRGGLYRWSGDTISDFVAPDLQAHLAATEIIDSIRLRDGSYALATIRGGVVLVDAEGRLVRWVSDANGLRTPLVARVVEDEERGLWCLVENGVSRLELGSPMTLFNELAGLKHTTCSHIVRHAGTLYVSTLRGLHRLVPSEGLSGHARFEPVEGTSGQVFTMWSHPVGLLAGVDAKLMQVDGSGSRQVWNAGSLIYLLQASRWDPDVVYVGTRYGLAALRFAHGAWREEGFLPGVEHEVRSLWEDPDGGVLWYGTVYNGAGRVEGLGRGGSWWEGATRTAFGPADGLPEDGMAFVEEEAGRPVFATMRGMFVYSSPSNRFAPAPDSLLRPAGGPDTRWVFSTADAAGNRWGLVEGLGDDASEVSFGYQSAAGAWSEVPIGLFDAIGSPGSLLLEESPGAKVLWVGGSEGLLRWDLGGSPAGVTASRLRVAIRRAGFADKPPMLNGAAGPLSPPRLPFEAGLLRFEFAAAGFDRDARAAYSTRLDGLDRTWSAWSTESAREFSYLPEGHYTFRVRARSPAGGVAEASAFAFIIMPPWYRAWYAFAAYGACGLAAIAGFVRWRGRALRRRNEELEAVVAARTRELRDNQENLVRAREEAERANRAKSAFLANMSHELRTPLNGILGYTQILRRDPSIQGRNQRRLAVLETSGEHLLRLINEVLDLSKIEAGRLELHPIPCDLRALIHAIAETLRPRAHEKGLGFEVRVEPGLPARVLLDEQKLGQVLFNLVGNAVKFTRAGRISLVVIPREGGACIEVADTGIGIAPALQGAIFEPFRQVGGADAAGQGTGLGLAIASRIVALMGGRLQLESELGRGSRFWFEIALTAVPESAGREEPVGERVVGYRGPRRCVLVVDDIAVNRDIVVEMLTPLGFEVVPAAGGAEALAQVAARRPDLVLLDLRMEPMSGAEVVRRLRAESATRDLAIAAFSASAIGFTHEDAKRLGCDDLLAKPFREPELLALLERHLGIEWLTSALAAPLQPGIGAGPDRADIETLLGFARRGDATGLRAALDALRTARPAQAAFVAEIESLVASYRMQEIRERLERRFSET